MNKLADLLCTLGNSNALLPHVALLLPRWLELRLLHLLTSRIPGLLFDMNAVRLLFDCSSLLCSRRRVVSWARTSSAFMARSWTGTA